MTLWTVLLFLDCKNRTPRYTRKICFGSERKVAMTKNQKLTSQVENTAVEKCEGMALRRMMRTI
jgi:hypothetical protein